MRPHCVRLDRALLEDEVQLEIVVLLVLVLAGTSVWQRTPAPTATAPGWSRVCVAGVSYLQFTAGASVEWTPAGKVKTCSEPAK